MDVKHDSSLMSGPVEAFCHTYAISPFDLFQTYTATYNLQCFVQFVLTVLLVLEVCMSFIIVQTS